MKFTQINTDTPEGKYLLAAVSLLTKNKTPESVMAKLQPIAVKVYGDDPDTTAGIKLSEVFLREVLRVFGPACEMTPGSGDYWPEQNGGELLIDIRDYLECKPQQCRDFEKELRRLINGLSMEAESDTPDFILAAYISGALENFNRAVRNRSNWYGNTYDTPSMKDYYKEPKFESGGISGRQIKEIAGEEYIIPGATLEARQTDWDRKVYPHTGTAKNIPARPSAEDNQAKAAEFSRILEINKSGYAGVDKDGRIVDRREKPDAIPVPANSIFNVPAPKPWPDITEEPETEEQNTRNLEWANKKGVDLTYWVVILQWMERKEIYGYRVRDDYAKRCFDDGLTVAETIKQAKAGDMVRKNKGGKS